MLILSAGVGRGHHAAADGLREELATAAPEVQVTVSNGLGAPRGALRGFLERFTRWQLTYCPRLYSFSYSLGVRSAPGRWIASWLLYKASRKGLAKLIASHSADVVVSTYPGITAPLGRMRQRGELQVPVCALITDLASLHFWAHSGVDLHLASYPESLAEIARLTRGAPAIAVKPPLRATHRHTRCSLHARRRLGMDSHAPIVLVTGGGWGLGDLRGAIDGAVGLEDAQVVVVCGENERATSYLAGRYRTQARVRVLGYTDAMADLLSAADVLVHGTGGVTCLEAHAHRCPVISYGLTVGHIRDNTRAMVRHGMIAHAPDLNSLTRLLRAMIIRPRRPPVASCAHPSAADSVLSLSLAPQFAADGPGRSDSQAIVNAEEPVVLARSL